MIRDATVNGIAASPLLVRPLRARMLRLLGVNLAKGVRIHPWCWFGGRDVAIGEGSWINYGVWFDNSATVTLGRNVFVGYQVLFCTSTHDLGRPSQRAGDAVGRPIFVGDGTWVGARATVLPGVTVGSGCVIAAGAVVTTDCAPNGLYAGTPARRLRDLDPGVDPARVGSAQE